MRLENDFELLSLMMEDMTVADSLFQPTAYWQVYEKRFLPELHKLGLNNFRQRRNSVLNSFGATDLTPRMDLGWSRLLNNRWVKKIPGWGTVLNWGNALLRALESKSFLPSNGITLKNLHEATYNLTRAVGLANGAEPLERFDASLIGNPEEVFIKNGTHYTTSAFYYYLRYAYCCRFVDFRGSLVIAELGSGCGKQVEVIKKLHPETRFFCMIYLPNFTYASSI